MQAKSKASRTPAPKHARVRARPAAAKAPARAAKSAKQQPVAATEAPVLVKPRVKPVRDSFTMPREDYDLIPQLKARALDFKRPTKKSELLRAGLQVLAALPDAQLHAALDALKPLKAGRPKRKR